MASFSIGTESGFKSSTSGEGSKSGWYFLGGAVAGVLVDQLFRRGINCNAHDHVGLRNSLCGLPIHERLAIGNSCGFSVNEMEQFKQWLGIKDEIKGIGGTIVNEGIQNRKDRQEEFFNSQINRIEDKKDAIIEKANDKVDALLAKIAELQASNTELKGQNSMLSMELRNSQSAVNKLEREVADQAHEIRVLRSRLEDSRFDMVDVRKQDRAFVQIPNPRARLEFCDPCSPCAPATTPSA